ncbi:hypothetical protein [Chryseobacterium sp. ISL-6]|uniref:hypothetical protein n=1 Tax=Chryseobacterium sp. ISL-6 TaxID=2819143 RepID=UPI001BE594FD|nr:hypothetical protein [Chryseobacterium sp. ISL-6]MBT2622086.1 hypothetical protein [Chryseobacterium sp. ISL-6]
MKKKWILIILGALVLIFLIIRYGFLLVFWLTTPNGGELSLKEQVLFERIKADMHVDKISREPKYDMAKSGDTVTYKIFVNNIKCDQWNDQQLQGESNRIKKEIDNMNLNKKFYKYTVIYRCKDGEDMRFSYLR